MKGLGSSDWSKALTNTKPKEQEKTLEEKHSQNQQQSHPAPQKRESNIIYSSPFKSNVSLWN